MAPYKKWCANPSGRSAEGTEKGLVALPSLQLRMEHICCKQVLGNGCPSCSKKDSCSKDYLANTNLFLAEEWHPTRNGDITPNDVRPMSSKKIWWICSICGHEWVAEVASRSRGNGCPACTSTGISLPEKAVLYYMRHCLGDSVVGQSIVSGYSVDVFVPHLRLVIEYDGVYYHQRQRDQDEMENKILQENRIRLVRVTEPGLSDIEAYGSLVVGGDTLLDRLHNLANCLSTHFEVNEHERVCLFHLNKLSGKEFKNDFHALVAIAKSVEKQKKLAGYVITPNPSIEWHPTKNRCLCQEENLSLFSVEKHWWCCRICGYEWQAITAIRSMGGGCPKCFKLHNYQAYKKRYGLYGMSVLVSPSLFHI